MVLLESLQLPMGSDIIDFSLPGTDGKMVSPSDFADKKAWVIIFMCNHCPYVQAILNRLIRLQSDYTDKGVQLIGINSNESDNYPDDSFENMKKTVEEKGINFVYLHDESQEVAKAYQAQCTPDIYMFDQNRKLAYHGRLDDNWQNENEVEKQELRMALDAILEGQAVSEIQHPSMGCSIKWK
ncbi:thioredoxin family protein [Candidatus Peregrinibacteria bacterium]|nr:thioredoxin family protein [Candidatus Peregrinibacteria bacterium]